jgi:SagB-type dehydrogenase family enzyme
VVEASEPTLTALSTLLRNTVGYQIGADGAVRRIAPTGGGLASPDLFIAALRVPGLDPGLYHYDAPRHKLERLPYSIDTEWTEALAADGPLPPCVLIGTGAAGRLYMKYQNFSFRILHLDAGVVQAYLLDTAHTLGLSVEPYDDMVDASLARILRLATRRNQNIVTFAYGISGGLEKHGRPESGFSPQVFDQVLGMRRQTYRSRVELTPASASQVRFQDAAGYTFGELLEQRRSVRDFAGLGASGEQVASILEAMDCFNAVGLHRLRFWVALREPAAGLNAGMYRFAPGTTNRFCAVRHTFTFENMLDLVSQRNIATAPAVVLCTGDLGNALRQRGPRGYRELLMSAGGAVARGLMAATYLGLGACPFGGIFESGLRRLTETDGYKDCPLFGFVFGEPKEQQVGS